MFMLWVVVTPGMFVSLFNLFLVYVGKFNKYLNDCHRKGRSRTSGHPDDKDGRENFSP